MAMWVRCEENNQSTNKENQLFDFIWCWRISEFTLAPIISIDVNLSEEYLATSTRNNNIYIVHVKSIGLNEQMDKEVKVDQLAKGFHSGPITTLDIAV